MTDLNNILSTGRVNEVCKEWLVREDGALAYRLQSEEITEHYKGNRHRNAVVRQDFPTALHEQIKEKENAERQAKLYHQMINEQEETDALIAKELAEKIKGENDKDRLYLQQQSELLIRKLQKQPSREKKSNVQLQPPKVIQQYPLPSFHNPAIISGITNQENLNSLAEQQYEYQQQQQQPEKQLNYVSLDLNPPKINQQKQQSTSYAKIAIGQTNSNNNINQSKNNNDVKLKTPEKKQINLHSHTPEKNLQNNIDISHNKLLHYQNQQQHSQQTKTQRSIYDFTSDHENEMNFTGNYSNNDDIINSSSMNEMRFKIQQNNSNDITDSIRQYNLPLDDRLTPPPPPSVILPPSLLGKTTKQYNNNLPLLYDDEDVKNNSNFKKLSPEKYDYLMGNYAIREQQQHPQSSLLLEDKNLNVNENFDRLKSFKDFYTLDEIKEIDRRLQQEKYDEELARKLQQQEESVEMNQEERDRALAMVAQDKELARMLQEREKLKAKRAKEKARLKKIQQLQTDFQKKHNEDEFNVAATSYKPNQLRSTTSDQIDIDDSESYSLPIDLLQLSTNDKLQGKKQPNQPPNTWEYYNPRENSCNIQASSSSQLGKTEFCDDNYSNPVDMLNEQKHKTFMNNTQKIDDEIYVLPVANKPLIRPNQLDLRGHINRPANSPLPIDNVATILTTSSSSSSTPMSPLLPDISDQNSLPYNMPIAGSRRNFNSQENKKKKSKEKCAHQ